MFNYLSKQAWPVAIATVGLALSPEPTFAAALPKGGCDRAHTEQDAHYDNGSVALAGLLFSSKVNGSHPGVVILQGSGASGRSNGWSRQFAIALVKCGIDVLLTDKRGSDQSKGDWHTATFADLALDGVAGLEYLSQQPGLDPKRLGFLGLSQGGIVAPLAGRLSDKATFVAAASGGAVASMEDTLEYELQQTYHRYALNPEQIKDLDRLTAASFRYIKSGEGWDEYLKVRAEIAAGPLAKATEDLPTSQDDWYWIFWRNIYAFDPLKHWQHVIIKDKLRGLAMYGAEDSKHNVDVVTSVKRLKQALPGNRFRVVVFPNTSHPLYMADRAELLPEMISTLTEFINSSAKN